MALALSTRNLIRRRSRTMLTVLSISLAIAGFVTMTSVTQAINYGVFSEVPENYLGYNVGYPAYADILVVEANQIVYGGLRLSEVPIDFARTVGSMEGVELVTVRIGEFSTILIGAKKVNSTGSYSVPSRLVRLLGIDPLAEDRLRHLSNIIARGQYFSEGDLDAVLVGESFADALGLKVGDRLQIPSGLEGIEGGATVQGSTFTVKGIFSSTAPEANDYVVSTISAMSRLLGYSPNTVTSVAIKVKAPVSSNLRRVAVDVSGTPNTDVRIPATTPQGRIELAVRSTQVTGLQMTSIALIVAILVTSNSMLISVFERTQEIGVLSASGAETIDIMKIFVYESTTVGLMSGSLGYALAIVGPALYNQTLATFTGLPQVPPKLDILWIMVSLSIGVGVSVISALIPARTAAGMQPIDIIRKELGVVKSAKVFDWMRRRSYSVTLALRVLSTRRMRTMLTATGIAVGVALLVSLLLASRGLVYALEILGLGTGGIESYMWVIAAVSIVVGALGTTNTMLTSVIERTREIGVKVGVGAPRSKILKEILVEASVIGLLGGAVGAAVGLLISTVPILFSVGAALSFGFWVYALLVSLGSVAFAVVVSVIAGVYPAHRAASMEPVEAFRHVW